MCDNAKLTVLYEQEAGGVGKHEDYVHVELRKWEVGLGHPTDYVLSSFVLVDGEIAVNTSKVFCGWHKEWELIRKAIETFDDLLTNHPSLNPNYPNHVNELKSRAANWEQVCKAAIGDAEVSYLTPISYLKTLLDSYLFYRYKDKDDDPTATLKGLEIARQFVDELWEIIPLPEAQPEPEPSQSSQDGDNGIPF